MYNKYNAGSQKYVGGGGIAHGASIILLYIPTLAF